jgi:hypothetical protein
MYRTRSPEFDHLPIGDEIGGLSTCNLLWRDHSDRAGSHPPQPRLGGTLGLVACLEVWARFARWNHGGAELVLLGWWPGRVASVVSRLRGCVGVRLGETGRLRLSWATAEVSKEPRDEDPEAFAACYLATGNSRIICDTRSIVSPRNQLITQSTKKGSIVSPSTVVRSDLLRVVLAARKLFSLQRQRTKIRATNESRGSLILWPRTSSSFSPSFALPSRHGPSFASPLVANKHETPASHLRGRGKQQGMGWHCQAANVSELPNSDRRACQ